MGRKSLAEVEARRNDVYEMLMKGKTNSFIMSYCATNWGVRRSSVEHDIAAVRQELNTQFLAEKQEIIASHIARYENLYRFYMEEGEGDDINMHFNPETASKMLEKKEKLLHLHNPDVVVTNNVQNNTLSLENLSFDELKKLMNE